MDQILRDHIERLKSNLLSLSATGEKGFEGLVAAALYDITGIPFRLASSGSQFGVDGKAAYEENAICFEGKRYKDKVPRAEVLAKIAELSINDSDTEIWVLGATTQISSQLADDARALGNKNGVFILILDWSETDLPPLAVALGMGRFRVQEFLKSNLSDKKVIQKTVAALEAIQNSQDFDSHSDRIRAQCNEPTVGWALAQRSNISWLTDVFSSKKRAKNEFGQPLSPDDTESTNVLVRKNLIDKLRPYLTTTSNDSLIFVLGGEGHGKSWVIAQSWLALKNKPLMLFMTPDDFQETSGQRDIMDIVIGKIIRQTGNQLTSIIQGRWRRRLKQLQNKPAGECPRIVVVIDGINQRPKLDWARIIEKIEGELNRFGGRLIVTSRSPYYQGYIKSRLSLPYAEISVNEWKEAERDEILARHDINNSDLHPTVATSLRNPRLLGVALELLDKTVISSFEELSVSRLLFEHIRTSERDAPNPQPAHEFAYRLQKHAQKIISRVKSSQQDDLNMFENDMGAVADGRFFHIFRSDPNRYYLDEDGLTLALAFSVIDRLLTAHRNNRNVDAELDAILEPISALDDTANVILAALTVVVTDERFEPNIITSLIRGFSGLQNPDETQFPAFYGMARSRPQVFMDAACALCLDGGHQPNFDWVQGALIEVSRSHQPWKIMEGAVHCWLSLYSLSPELACFKHPTRDPDEEVQEEREKNRKKIEEKLQALNQNERVILQNLHEQDGDISRLSRLALVLLAGKKLTPFAKSLINWCFSCSLNSDHYAPHKEFTHLLRLNRVDWLQTRNALLELSVALRETDISAVGKWALVYILRATGHPDDSYDAAILVEELTKDRPTIKGWRLVEKYCETDPCDPTSIEPENMAQTAKQYSAIDVSLLSQGMGNSSEDHYFSSARPGISRFKPEIAVAKHREFAIDVLGRSGLSMRQGVFELRQHNVLFTTKQIDKFIAKYLDVMSPNTTSDLTERDVWIVSQYILLLAFPLINAEEQFEILLSDGADENMLLDLLYLVKPLGKNKFSALFKNSWNKNDERTLYLLLILANYSFVKLTRESKTYIAELFQSKSEKIHIQALSIIMQSNDEVLLNKVAKSNWNASDTESDNSFENWYGSVALLEAAKKGLIAHSETLERISERLYGRATTVLDADTVHKIALRIDASFRRVIGLEENIVAPDIELQILPKTPDEPSRFSVSERSSEEIDIQEAIKKISESNEEFNQRQKLSHEAFLQFRANLTQNKASIILDNISFKEFEIVIENSKEFADIWYQLFIDLPEKMIPAVHNFIVLLAHAIASKTPKKAENLFLRIKNSNPTVRLTYDRSGVLHEAMAIWSCVRSPILDDMRFLRLDLAGTDYAFFQEVLAALMNDKHDLLTSYIQTKLHKKEPAEIARGIMVAGFSDQNKFSEEVLKKYEGFGGLIGSAHKAAKYAYERNAWARHWFKEMCQTNKNTDFWCYSVLFMKIVDGRFTVWGPSYTKEGKPIQLFDYTIDSNLKNRYERWKNLRNKKLFGSDVPESIFLIEKTEPVA